MASGLAGVIRPSKGGFVDTPKTWSRTQIERFIDIVEWPASQKVVLLIALALPSQVIATYVVRWGIARTGGVNLEVFDQTTRFGYLSLVIPLLVSLPYALRRREGAWLPYLSTSFYGVFTISLAYIFGTMSTPFMAMYPLLVILWTLYFGERFGWFGFSCLLILMVGVGVLEQQGVIPYAPLLIDRSIDNHRNGAWFLALLFTISQSFLFCFLIGLLTVGRLRIRESELRRAHGKLVSTAQALERSRQLISRYLPSQLAESIISGQYVDSLAPERRKLTIFFSDVEGFTDASDEVDAEELAALLNEYLSEMTAIADCHGATVGQVVGDGIMAFFGAPQASNDRDHALHAVRMALDMQARMIQLHAAWFKQGIQRPFRIRIGINTGYASVGDFGSVGRKVYSAIGVQTNLAARIQAHCPAGAVLISHSTWALVHDQIDCQAMGELQVKGIHYPVRVYQVADGKAGVAR